MEISTLLKGLWHYLYFFGMVAGPFILLGLIAGLITGWFREAIAWWVLWGGGVGFVVGCIVFALILRTLFNMDGM